MFHEIGHNYEAWHNKSEQQSRSKESDPLYNDKEEKYIIENYENPMARKLNESERNNHSGITTTTSDPTSKKPTGEN